MRGRLGRASYIVITTRFRDPGPPPTPLTGFARGRFFTSKSRPQRCAPSVRGGGFRRPQVPWRPRFAPLRIAFAFEELKGRAEALYVVGESLTGANQVRINSFALAARLPTMLVNREWLEAGGLMSYGPNFASLYRRAGDLVDKILRGAKPADIPVEQPSKFDLIINLTTAKAIGLKVPESFLLRADEVIE